MLSIDITDTFLTWSGSPNGIQRTLLGLACASNQREDCQLCVWHRASDSWRVIPQNMFGAIFESSGPLIADASQAQAVDMFRFLRTHWRMAARGAINAVSRGNQAGSQLVPKPAWCDVALRKPFQRFRAFRRTSRVSNPDPHHAEKRLEALPRAIFDRPGDALLFADSHWNQIGILREWRKRFRGPLAVGFCYDVIPLERPDFVEEGARAVFAEWFDEMRRHSDQIVCISEHSARRLKATFSADGSPSPPIRSVRFGNTVDQGATPDDESRPLGSLLARHGQEVSHLPERVGASSDWYLWVGSLDLRKNLDVLFLAVEGLARTGRLHRPVVIVGRRSSGYAYYRHKIECNPVLREWLVHVEAAPDRLLQDLYGGAELVLFTSWEEGYGLPVAEALQAGAPVLASNATSIPEVAGDLVDYFEPWNSGQLAGLIERFETDPAYRANLKARAARFVPTDWNETIDDIISGLPAGAA
jgi:glycosyltransferase involved in cell wall biosynthesis